MTFGTIMRTFVFALFGAAFGYILGGIIELFPALNQALLGMLHFLGMGNATISGLLAALGLLAGAVLGLAISFMMPARWHDMYARPMRREMRRARRYFRYGNTYGRYGHYGCDADYGHAPRSVEETLQEIDSYVSYLEDLPKDRLIASESEIVRLSARLADLKAAPDGRV